MPFLAAIVVAARVLELPFLAVIVGAAGLLFMATGAWLHVGTCDHSDEAWGTWGPSDEA